MSIVRRGFLKGLAAVVLGVATSLPALKHDPVRFRAPMGKGVVLFSGNIQIHRPNEILGIRGFKDSFH